MVSVYSYRSATTGSSLAALTAGYIPKKIPSPIETTTPKSTAQSGTLEGRLGTSALISHADSEAANYCRSRRPRW